MNGMLMLQKIKYIFCLVHASLNILFQFCNYSPKLFLMLEIYIEF